MASPNISIRAGLTQIYAHAAGIRRRQFHIVLGLMILGAVAEVATIGSVIPFLALVAGLGEQSGFRLRVGFALGTDGPVAAGLIFAAIATFAGIVRLALARSSQDFVYSLGNDLTVDIERRILLQPYGFHVAQNSARLIAILSKVEDLVFEVLLPSMQALTAAFLVVVIAVVLLCLDPVAATIAAAAFIAVYAAVSAAARKSLARNSEVTAHSISERMQIAQESLGGIRDVIIDGTHEAYLETFKRANLRLYKARANTAFIAIAPRFVIETLGIVIIAVVAIFIAGRDGGIVAALPTLGAIALGAQRLLPLVNQVYSGSATARGARVILAEIVELLHLPDTEAESTRELPPLPFLDRIRVDGISFTYPSRQSPALYDVSFEVARGSSVAIVGETGSGKSTLADLLMGLLDPDQGSISIDGAALSEESRRRWQRNIAHVPQSIFLADATIASNIALAVAGEAADLDRVIVASKRAQLDQSVEALPEGYSTRVGERGIRLSGGQRQRLGLARAIYKGAPVLILDEPTSALDYETEAAVIRTLEDLREAGSTIIIIAHRHSTIRHCDFIVRLEKGRLVEFGHRSEGSDFEQATAGKPRP